MQKFASTLRFSNYFVAIQAMLLLGSIVGIVYLPYGSASKVLLIGLVIGYGIFNFYRQTEWSVISHDEDGWYLTKGHTQVAIQVAGDSTITPWVTLLRFHQPDKRRKQSYMIFNDAMPLAVYRQFTVRLRYAPVRTVHTDV